jgi:hypothetical protein
MSNAGRLVCIYRSNGPLEAHQISHWLERNGIDVQVHGDLASIAGGIPVNEAWPSLWVHATDASRAEAEIKHFKGPTMIHPEWTCPSCNETNGPNFGSCWSCGHLQPRT